MHTINNRKHAESERTIEEAVGADITPINKESVKETNDEPKEEIITEVEEKPVEMSKPAFSKLGKGKKKWDFPQVPVETNSLVKPLEAEISEKIAVKEPKKTFNFKKMKDDNSVSIKDEAKEMTENKPAAGFKHEVNLNKDNAPIKEVTESNPVPAVEPKKVFNFNKMVNGNTPPTNKKEENVLPEETVEEKPLPKVEPNKMFNLNKIAAEVKPVEEVDPTDPFAKFYNYDPLAKYKQKNDAKPVIQEIPDMVKDESKPDWLKNENEVKTKEEKANILDFLDFKEDNKKPAAPPKKKEEKKHQKNAFAELEELEIDQPRYIFSTVQTRVVVVKTETVSQQSIKKTLYLK
eukprot:TRINITY_DN88674_c1_g1_i1.p2 TRINITY_DN88674_c1_g1~~TRINITY_DN88674_c1_g1_i1.p2  ORF type:complete len:349 (-),score=75.62 TRINITY_DN88674_c1_g1_i1:2009-3055(-)